MSRLRFHTDVAVFEMFPDARDHIRTPPVGEPPLAFVDRLAKRSAFEDALAFCAYALPRREAVAWGCRSLGGLGMPPRGDRPALEAAEAWVAMPAEETRRTAYDRWRDGDREDPVTWLALAAAWSGGSLLPDVAASPPAARHLTAMAVRTGLRLALHRISKADKPRVARAWIAQAKRFAEDGL